MSYRLMVYVKFYLPLERAPTLGDESLIINITTRGVSQTPFPQVALGDVRGRVLRMRGKSPCFPRPRHESSGLEATGTIFSTSISYFYRDVLPAPAVGAVAPAVGAPAAAVS